MTPSQVVTLGPEEASQLLQRLRKTPALKDAPEFKRLYFVDVDVLSAYVDGGNSDIAHEWSSLFSLTGRVKRNDRESVSEEASDIAHAIARSVSGFLLGRFRDTRTMQFAQLWMTPEHVNELDSMVRVVLSAQPAAMAQWQARLRDQYLNLAAAGDISPDELSSRLEGIFRTLMENAATGKVARIFDVKRRFTSPLTQMLVAPPPDLARNFVLRADTTAFEPPASSPCRPPMYSRWRA